MKVRARVWEEVYGRRKNVFDLNVDELREEQYISIGKTKDGKIVFDYTMPGFICRKDYKILKANKKEVKELKKLSIQKIESKIEELKEEIEECETKYPVILEKSDVHFMKTMDAHTRRYDTKSPMQKGVVTMNLSIMDMIQKRYLHPNNTDSLYLKHGGFVIANKKVREFVKRIDPYGSDEHHLIWLGDKFGKIKAYEQHLQWAKEIPTNNIDW